MQSRTIHGRHDAVLPLERVRVEHAVELACVAFTAIARSRRLQRRRLCRVDGVDVGALTPSTPILKFEYSETDCSPSTFS